MDEQERGVGVGEPETRRGLLIWIIAGLSGLIAFLLAVPSFVYLFLVRPSRKDSGWMDAGELSPLEADIPREISFRYNRVDGWKIHSGMETAWLSKDSNGKPIAFSPWCTHLGCAYRWELANHEFTCPCHGSRFDRDGAVLSGPATRPLDRYQIRVTGKRLWLAPLNVQRTF